MASSSTTTYPDWKAPREDGEVLISPDPAQIIADTLENQKRLSTSDVRIQNAALSALRSMAIEAPMLAPTLTNAVHELDWSLGLRHSVFLATPIWTSEAFLIFAHHLIARACSFARSYNAALAAYRREKKVRTPTRPMP